MWLELIQALEPIALVVAGALITGVGNWLNERRRRKNDLEDRREADKAERDERTRVLLLEILEQRSKFIQASDSDSTMDQKPAAEQAIHGMMNTAAATGDREVIKAVEYFLSDDHDDEGELLALVTDRIKAMNAPAEPGRWWRRALSR